MDIEVGKSKLYKRAEFWTLHLQGCRGENEEPVIFIHIDTDKVNKTVIQEMRDTLSEVHDEYAMDISYFTQDPKIARLANMVRKLDMECEVLAEGVPTTVGTWEYSKCQ